MRYCYKYLISFKIRHRASTHFCQRNPSLEGAYKVILWNVLQTARRSHFEHFYTPIEVYTESCLHLALQYNVHIGQIWTNRWLEKRCDDVLCQVTVDYKTGVSCSIVMMQILIRGNVWPHSIEHFLQSFQHFQVESTRDGLTFRYRFMVNHVLRVKEDNEHDFGIRNPPLSLFCSLSFSNSFWIMANIYMADFPFTIQNLMA